MGRGWYAEFAGGFFVDFFFFEFFFWLVGVRLARVDRRRE